MRTVGQLKDGVAGLLTGTNLDKVTNLYKAFERAARKLSNKADVPEAIARQAITLYDGVYDYPADEEIFGGAIVDLRPQGASRSQLDVVTKANISTFDRNKGLLPSGYSVAFEWRKGVPVIRIATPKPTPHVLLDRMSSDDGWTAAGSASALTEDATVYYESPASLRFTLTGSSTGTLTRSLSNALDLASYEGVGVAFLALRIPDGATTTNLTSIAVRLGSSASAYDEVSNTAGFLGAWTAGEWLLVALNFSAASRTGTPDWTALEYLQVSLAHTGTFTNMRVGGIWIALPSPHEFLYQTAAIFLEGGALTTTIADDDTEIILSDSSYLLFEHECALAIAVQQAQDKKAETLRRILYGGEGKTGLYDNYTSDNPSQEVRTTGNYYL